ncbi:SIS domain-containing protein [Klebsiella pneumoniae]
MNCLTRIRQRYPTLAASDKKLADYILSQPDETRHLSSQQLAAEAGVSQSSVVKFAQKLGFKGFPALKLALSEALASSPDPHSVPVHNHIRGDDPLRLVGEKLIKDNVAAMHALLATVQAMSSDDLLLAISYSGERREINMAAGEALRVGCKILAITGFSPNALQQQATHCLYTIAEEQATRSAAISSTSAQMMLTDLLFMGLVQQDLERAPERIRHSEALVKKLV